VRRAGALARIGALLLALILLFIAAIAASMMARITDTPPCEDTSLFFSGECFDGSGGAKVVSLVTGWPAACLIGVSCVLAFAFMLRGRNGRRLGVLSSTAFLLFLFNVGITRMLTG
jgi:cytochrome bd-type quinol oxidase subunit 2